MKRNIIIGDVWCNDLFDVKIISHARHLETKEELIVCYKLPTEEDGENIAIPVQNLFNNYKLKKCGNNLFCCTDCSSCERFSKEEK